MSQQDIAANNKRILKNSLYLYLRMFLTMAIGVYTTRIVLRTLGEVDFGLYGVVGGLVYMLAFIECDDAINLSVYYLCYRRR